MRTLRQQLVDEGILVPAPSAGDPTGARWIDKPTLRLDRAALEEIRNPRRHRRALDEETDRR